MSATTEVLARISAVFADVARPDNDHLFGTDDDGAVELYDIGDWRDLPDEVANRKSGALSFLSPEGFRFFLPAYMTTALRSPHGNAYEFTMYALWFLRADLREYQLDRFEALDARQAGAVAAFIEHIAEDFEPLSEQLEAALAYWRERAGAGV